MRPGACSARSLLQHEQLNGAGHEDGQEQQANSEGGCRTHYSSRYPAMLPVILHVIGPLILHGVTNEG